MTRLPDHIVQQALKQVADDKAARIERLHKIASHLSTIGASRISVSYEAMYFTDEPKYLKWTYHQYVDVPPNGTTPWIAKQLILNPVEPPVGFHRDSQAFMWKGYVPSIDEEVEVIVVGEYIDAHAGGW